MNCAEKEGEVQAAFRTIYTEARASDRLNLFRRVTVMGTSRTKAFKAAFSGMQLEPDTFFETSLQNLIDTFFKETVLKLLTTCAGEINCISDGNPRFLVTWSNHARCCLILTPFVLLSSPTM